jgi:TolB protein
MLLAVFVSISCKKERPDTDAHPPSAGIDSAATNTREYTAEPDNDRPDRRGALINSDKPIPSSLAKPLPSSDSDEIPISERRKIAGAISFVSERDGNREVYRIEPDGQGERRLTKSPHADYNGPASPDGSALLVIRAEGEDGPQNLLLQPLDGSTPRPLGPPMGRIGFPTFSPDGQFVVFESNGSKQCPSHFSDIYRVESDGKGWKRLTNNPEGNFEPAISPKGDSIVLISSRDRVAELYRIRMDGSEPTRLTHTPRDEWGARFSPDAKQMAFVSDREGADRIWLMPLLDSGGGEARRLTQQRPAPRIVEDKPAWSPTGKQIAYVLRIPDEPSRVVLVDMAKGKETVVTAPGGVGQVNEPSWSPDGRYLAITVTRGAEQQIWLVRANGSGRARLTTSVGGNWNPIWMAPGKKKKKQ